MEFEADLRFLFNVKVKDDDDDAQSASNNSVINEEQLATLQKLIKDTNSNIDAFCQVMRVEALPDIPANQFAHAKQLLEDKEKRQKTKKAAEAHA